MRTFLVLICSLALAFGAAGASKKDKKSHKSGAKKEHLVAGKGKGKPYKARSSNFKPRRARGISKV
jgi:hypothetical protein